MHISEGILTGTTMVATNVAGAAVVAWGAASMAKFIRTQPERKPLLGMAGAFVFIVSLMPIPAFAGTCSHPCGTPLAAILLGPGIAAGLSFLALLLQALFFAHGGLSSLGANTLTLGLLGGGVGWLVFRVGRKAGLSVWAAAALGGLLGDIATYLGAGLILSWHLAFYAATPKYTFAGYLTAIYAAYLPVQGPLALLELIFTGVVLHSVARQRPEVLESLGVLPRPRLVGTTLAVLLGIGALCGLSARAGDDAAKAPQPQQEEKKAFTGMDESVNEKLAENAGAPSRKPFIDTEGMGDLWNFVLLLGGATAGFIIGRYYHLLFGKQGSGTPAPAGGTPDGCATGGGGEARKG